MEEVIINGITYSINLATKTISWKVSEMNYTISMFEFIFNIDIARATCTYRSTINNLDLLLTAGLSQQDAELNVYSTQGEQKGQVYFTPDSLEDAALTANDLMRWVNRIMGLYFNYEPYEKVGENYQLKVQP